MNHRFESVEYAGRAISASTATGYGKLHKEELQKYLDAAMAWAAQLANPIQSKII